MSPQDSQLLQDFLNQLVQTRGVPKDPEADAMISKAVAQQPDAPYLLVQRALLQQQALNNAKAEIAALQNQLRSTPQGAPAFLDPNAWGSSSASRPLAGPQAGPVLQANVPPAYQQPQMAQPPGSAGGFLRGGMGSTLGNIASTAAGVAAGGFLFQGLEHLLGNHPGNGFLGSQSGFSSLTAPLENITDKETPSDLASNTGADSSSSDDLSADSSSDLTDNSFDDSSLDDDTST